MQDPRKVKYALNKATASVIKSSALLIILMAALFFSANDNFFHIDGVPSSADVVHFFGGGVKPYVKLKDNEACVYFIDVGQGDCELITCGGYNILIDCGEEDSVYNVSRFLKYSGIERLDLVIVTHQHIDHMGGMYNLIQEYDVGQLIMPSIADETLLNEVPLKKMLAAAELKNITVKTVTSGEKYLLGENSYLQILAPLYFDYKNINNFSVAAKFVHGKNSFLFTGDMEREGELDLAYSNWDLNCDVLKVGHHGSAGSVCEELLAEVKPGIAVFETDEINYYGHPRTEVIERLENIGCKEMYFTARDGNIAVISDGQSLHTITEKG